MRNSSYGGEDLTKGMIIDAYNDKERYDPSAQFGPPVNGKSAQLLSNNGNVDSGLAAFILANTGGANSPYAWVILPINQRSKKWNFPTRKFYVKMSRCTDSQITAALKRCGALAASGFSSCQAVPAK
ncbi:hypothetical protein DIC66_15435 [Rhodoferax lacus]|uniref:Uncharacterized protein n=1 Tax=Rhodoferax lacus TaxID=2184758 RepID=A0A3E1R9S4_9BURK|nr:hypothetical protein [Rhodoferax lacus]RFO96105.1 hypothetical protein DIC66_15435 [Rhodoferax lacus]